MALSVNSLITQSGAPVWAKRPRVMIDHEITCDHRSLMTTDQRADRDHKQSQTRP